MLICSSRSSLSKRGGAIVDSMMGAELLGWEGNRVFELGLSTLGYTHLRWPGGIPCEDGIDVNGDGQRDEVFSVVDPEMMTWRRWASEADKLDGTPEGPLRPGLSYVIEKMGSGVKSLSIVLPTARYAEMILKGASLSNVEREISKDIEIFSSNLKAKISDFGVSGKAIVLEIGSEYYATNVWRKYNSSAFDDPYGGRFASDPLSAFSKVFAKVSAELQNFLGDEFLRNEIKIAVQTERLNSRDDQGNFDGQASDRISFVNELKRYGAVDAVDAIITHRYVNEFDYTNHGFKTSFQHGTYQESFNWWSEQLGREVDRVIGWLSPDAQYSGIDEFGPIGDANLLNLFSNFALVGFEFGSIFGTNIPREGALSNGSTLYSGGALYRDMISNLIDLHPHEENLNNVKPSSHSFSENHYRFSNESKEVIYHKINSTVGLSNDRSFFFEGTFSSFSAVVHRYSSSSLETGQYGVEPVVIYDLNVVSRTTSSGTLIEVQDLLEGDLIRLIVSKVKKDGFTDIPYSDVVPTYSELVNQGTLSTTSGASIEFSNDIQHLNGSSGMSNQLLIGNELNNEVWGGSGNDFIDTKGGDDKIFAGDGDDYITISRGNKVIFGGRGKDTFTVKDNYDARVSILDFNPSEDDLIYDHEYASSNGDNGAVIELGIQGTFSFDDIF